MSFRLKRHTGAYCSRSIGPRTIDPSDCVIVNIEIFRFSHELYMWLNSDKRRWKVYKEYPAVSVSLTQVII